MVGSMTSIGRRLRKRQKQPLVPAPPGRPFDVVVTAEAFGTLIAVTGEVDIATSPRLRTVLADRPRTEGLLLLDLTAVTFMDSSGLSAVLNLQRDTTAAGERLAVVCPPGPARLLLEVTGVDTELPLFATRDAALA